ncbi:hypothetical protein SAMN05661086_01277 [Anaeromicropila populeti]|uniref:Uncharacterized protein n=1 Tax=Anaeromicropila populeti TaxID=37658 RepID=A0A1I6IZ66_9FIRM|nr:hypothetical protein [Anaeromicropila populeti]SFR72007.1 hypothetical protein SAMN05661086_01277 [Anaeromicropila populeti]
MHKKKIGRSCKGCCTKAFYGLLENNDTNIQPIIDLFPKWNVKEADKNWCAAFVYYCCLLIIGGNPPLVEQILLL